MKYYQERYPPANLPPADANGFRYLESPTLGMIQGWYYLPYRLTEWQWKWATVSWAVGAFSVVVGLCFFWIIRRVPWTPSKFIVFNLVLADRLQTFLNSSLWHPPAVILGHHWQGYYTCQIMGYFGGFWGIATQSFTFLFILDRYLSLVHRFSVTNWQAKQMVCSVWMSAFFIPASPFIFGRRMSVAPSALYCQPIWSNGGDWVGWMLGLLGFAFVGTNMIGAAFMYLQIYRTFVRTTREAEKAIGGGGTTAETGSDNIAADLQPDSGNSHRYTPTKSVLAFKKGCADDLHKESTVLAYNLARQAFVYYACYAVCMAPVGYQFLHHVIFQMPPPEWFDLIVYMATYGFTFTNPILLVTLNQHYRSAALDEWELWRRKLRLS
ncbi:hypothetical protein DFS34DRAFT_304428 [Phlyctochytrium arcticum]|nr:hypothetical protein DFS34DRAFT_304428 [Phlyctochytrium arcticum]